jgi:putative transposase
LQDVLKRLDKAFDNFFRRVKAGETPGYPRFQGYHRYNSFTYPQSGYSVIRNKLKLSKIGEVKIKLHRPLEGKIKTCTIIRKNGKYYACFSCEVETKEMPITGQAVGIDMGIKEFVITSDGETVENPKTYRKAEKKLKKAQRRVSRRKKGSNRRKKAVRILANKHEKVKNQRKDIAFKTANKLLKEYDTVVHEDLNIKGMVKNHNLAKSISDASWCEFVRQLQYKAEWNDKIIQQISSYFASSQICNVCGYKNIGVKDLSVREWNCPECHTIHDRDNNAALNILNEGLRLLSA